MRIKSVRKYFKDHGYRIYPLTLISLVIGGLMLYKLGSLTGGLSPNEIEVARTPLGWQGLVSDPFYLPLKFLRSLLFVVFDHHGQTVVRLANTVFGVIAVVVFSRLLQLWYGGRTALLGSILFLTSAWVLHVSRFASNDVLYLVALPLMLYLQVTLRQASNRLWFFAVPVIWGLSLYIPGLVWLVVVQIWLLRSHLVQNWQRLNAWWQKLALVLSGIIWLPLLIVHLSRSLNNVLTWLGLPTHVPNAIEILKQFLGVPLHLFIHGPKSPDLWLGKSPILDVFSLICCVLGIYFYATHRKASRSRALFSLFIVSWILVAIGGPVPLSLGVPLLYLFAACGIGYLLHDWLKVFPRNPLARWLGVSLIVLAVSMSVVYNLRAYYIAWPHNSDTISTFTEKP
jgi:hypothetical protein